MRIAAFGRALLLGLFVSLPAAATPFDVVVRGRATLEIDRTLPVRPITDYESFGGSGSVSLVSSGRVSYLNSLTTPISAVSYNTSFDHGGTVQILGDVFLHETSARFGRRLFVWMPG